MHVSYLAIHNFVTQKLGTKQVLDKMRTERRQKGHLGGERCVMYEQLHHHLYATGLVIDY